MKKNVFHWMLIAAMVCGLGMSVTSCKDDDDDENVTEQRNDDANPLDTDEARTAFRWINYLTDNETIDEGWQSKTFDVTLGEPSSQNELVRIIVVSSLDEAKKQFSLLANLTAEELSGKQTVNGGAAGTMTWTPSAEGAKNLAEVAVSSRIFPRLQKLVYCTEAQVGDNGILWDSMKGTAFYRLGDVIQDSEGYYWVCVRPAFKPDNKKSHWINIFNAARSGGSKSIPSGNIIDKWNNLPKYNNQTIILPTKLSYDREHIYNLSNFIWALLNPEAYKNAVLNNQNIGLGGFEYTYHGENFLKLVGNYWEQKIDGYTIWEKLFNRTGAEMKKMKKMNFLYQGYSWKWGDSGYLFNYSSEGYKPNYSGKESQDEMAINYVSQGLDIRQFASTPGSQALPYPQFYDSGNDAYSNTWVVRYKTGAELMTSGSYSPYSQITSKTPGQHDVYRFNEKQGVSAGEDVAPKKDNELKNNQVSDAKLVPGMLIGSDGNFYYDVNTMAKDGIRPAAMVVLAYSATPVEAGTNYNCLAIGLNSDMTTKETVWGEKGRDCGLPTCTTWAAVPNVLNGIAATQHLADGCNKGHNHPAAQSCATVMTQYMSDAVRQQKGFSQWFLPSVGQWKMAMEGMGCSGWRVELGFMADTGADDAIHNRIKEAGLEDRASELMTRRYHTSTARDADQTSTLYLGQTWIMTIGVDKDSELLVRPFIAFHKDK